MGSTHNTHNHGNHSFHSLIALWWGILGVAVMLFYSIIRLSHIVIENAFDALHGLHWFALLLCCAVMAYTEGYKAFQCKFCPRVVARAMYLAHHASLKDTLFAPFFCFCFYGTTRKRLLSTGLFMSIITLMILLTNQLPLPWQIIIYAGVALGLFWGVISLLLLACLAYRNRNGAINYNENADLSLRRLSHTR